MENYNETAGNNRNNRNNGSIRDNNQEKLAQRDNDSQSYQEQQEQGKRPVYIKDMPEIKPEINQGGI